MESFAGHRQDPLRGPPRGAASMPGKRNMPCGNKMSMYQHPSSPVSMKEVERSTKGHTQSRPSNA
eukprot:5811801-Amphidinium_carterae.1